MCKKRKSVIKKYQPCEKFIFRQLIKNFADYWRNISIFLNITSLKNIICKKINVSTIGHETSWNFLIFVELIMCLHMYNVYLEKLALDSSVVQQPSTKNFQVLLISGEIIMNLSSKKMLPTLKITCCALILSSLCKIIVYFNSHLQR